MDESPVPTRITGPARTAASGGRPRADSAQHEHRGVRAVQRMVEFAPSSGSLALWVRHRDLSCDLSCDLSATVDAAATAGPAGDSPVYTDGLTVFYRPAFDALPLDVQTGWVAHQVLHIALRHTQRQAELRKRLGDVDAALFNLCADAIVNSALSHLRWLRLPARALRLEDVLDGVLRIATAPEAALLEWDVERLYRAVDDRRAAASAGANAAGRDGGDGSSGSSSSSGSGSSSSSSSSNSNSTSNSNGNGNGNGGTGAGSSVNGKSTGSGSKSGEAGGWARAASTPPWPPGAEPASAGGTATRRSAAAAAAAAAAPPTAQRGDGPRAARLRALGSGIAPDLLCPDASAAASPEAEADAAREWGERLLRAHAGDGPRSLLRTLLADVPRPRTPWEQVLRVQCARALAQRPGLSWSRPTRSYTANQGRAGPHRRLPWEPGTASTRAVPRLVLVLDNSGSIDDGLLARFSAEINALVRRLEAALVLVVGDCRVRSVRRFEPGRCDLNGLAVGGGGGTDFTPLLEEAERHRPDLIVVLTDLDGPARHRPRCPVLWAVPETHAAATAAAPFGRLLVLR